MKKRLMFILLLSIILTGCCSKSDFEKYKIDNALNYKINPGYYEIDINNYIDWDPLLETCEYDPYYARDRVLKANIKGYVSYVDSKYCISTTYQKLLFDEFVMNYDVDLPEIGATKGYIKSDKNNSIIVDDNKNNYKKNIYMSGSDYKLRYYVPVLIEHPNEVGVIKYIADNQLYNANYYVDDKKLEYSYQLDVDSRRHFIKLDHTLDRLIKISILKTPSYKYVYTHTFTGNFEDNILTSFKTVIKYSSEDSDKVKSILEINAKKIEPFDVVIDEDTSDVTDLVDISLRDKDRLYDDILDSCFRLEAEKYLHTFCKH